MPLRVFEMKKGRKQGFVTWRLRGKTRETIAKRGKTPQGVEKTSIITCEL